MTVEAALPQGRGTIRDADAPRPVVLFVDDEESVLDGLRTTLRKLRHHFDLRYALGAGEALDVLEGTAVDVVVTDMRMPGMNGVELLRRIRDEHPAVIRFVLSGEAGQDLVLRAVPLTHRWLTKPCPREQLSDALADAVSHRAVMHDPLVGAALGGTASLPSPPTVYAMLVSQLQEENVSVAAVARVIGGDAAISAKILHLANSAYAGGSRVHDVQSAVVRLGLATISQLVLAVEIVRVVGDHAVPGLTGALLHDYGLAASDAAAALAAPERTAAAGAAALLANAGLLLLADRLPQRLAESYRHAEQEGLRLVDSEQQLHGLTHPEVASHLLSIWGLPTDLVLSVLRSHDLPDPAATAPMAVDEAVRAARLVAQSRVAGVGQPHTDPLDPALTAAAARWAAVSHDRTEAV